MNGRDQKLNKKLVEACSNLSSFLNSSDFIDPAEYNSYLEDYNE